MKDDLSRLLSEWQPEVPEAQDFRRSVWQRIETAAVPAEPGWATHFFELLCRPRLAVPALALTMALGGFAGWQYSTGARQAAYLRSVNPYAQLP